MADPSPTACRIEPLADHLALVPAVAGWHWREWGHGDPAGSLATWTASLAGRLGRDALPATYVALHDARPVGSVSLVERDMATRPELGPWLASLYVEREWRGRGLARLLVRHAEQRAGALGLQDLYLYTTTAVGLYRRLGWEPAFEERYGDEDVTVMRRRLAPEAAGEAPPVPSAG